MKRKRELVTFDWAMKKLLRAKANFKVLEGFLSELLRDDITILEILESESNRETPRDKQNCVDILVKDRLDRRIIIEVQYAREDDYLQRILYGASRLVTDSLSIGHRYQDIARVVSVSIVHFDLGQGEDYIYEGRTEFRGLHRHDRLGLTDFQRSLFHVATVEDIFPEYFILKVNNFDDVAHDGLDQWIYFLKNGAIQPSFTARGLKEAQSALDVMRLSESERQAYEAYWKDRRVAMGVAQSTVMRAESAEKALEEAKARAEEEKARAEAEKARADMAIRQAIQEKEEARRQKEEAVRQKDAAMAKALAALMAHGMSEAQARALLERQD